MRTRLLPIRRREATSLSLPCRLLAPSAGRGSVSRGRLRLPLPSHGSHLVGVHSQDPIEQPISSTDPSRDSDLVVVRSWALPERVTALPASSDANQERRW